jgi:hypothetical protein
VAHTPEQRDRHALCGARKKNGDACRNFAGQGTEHFGVGRCSRHLGNTKNHRVHAVKEEALKRTIQFGQPLDIQPAEALLATVHLSAGHLQFLRDELGTIDDRKSFEAQVLLRQYNEERDRLTRTSKLACDAGVAERIVFLAESYGEQMAALLRAVFFDGDLDLTPGQREQLPVVLRRHLSRLEERPALTRATD